MKFIKSFFIQFIVFFKTITLVFAAQSINVHADYPPTPLVFPIVSLPNSFYETFTDISLMGHNFLVINSDRNTYLFDGSNWDTIRVDKAHTLHSDFHGQLYLVGRKVVEKLYTLEDEYIHKKRIIDSTATQLAGPIFSFLPVDDNQFLFTTTNGLWLQNDTLLHLDSTSRECKLLNYTTNEFIYLKDGEGAFYVDVNRRGLTAIEGTQALLTETVVAVAKNGDSPMFFTQSAPYLYQPNNSPIKNRLTFNGVHRSDIRIKKAYPKEDYILIVTEPEGYGLIEKNSRDVHWIDGQTSGLAIDQIVDIALLPNGEFLLLTNASILRSTNTQFSGVFADIKGHGINGQNLLISSDRLFVCSNSSLFTTELGEMKSEDKTLRKVHGINKPVTGMVAYGSKLYFLNDNQVYSLNGDQLQRVNIPSTVSAVTNKMLATINDDVWMFCLSASELQGFSITNSTSPLVNLPFPENLQNITHTNIYFYSPYAVVQHDNDTWWYTKVDGSQNHWEVLNLNPAELERLVHIPGSGSPIIISKDEVRQFDLSLNRMGSSLFKQSSNHIIPIFMRDSTLVVKVQSRNFADTYSIWLYHYSAADSSFVSSKPMAPLLSSTIVYNTLYTSDSILFVSTNRGLIYFSQPLVDAEPVAGIHRAVLSSNKNNQVLKDGYFYHWHKNEEIFTPKNTYRFLTVTFSGLAGNHWNFGLNKILFSSKLSGVDSDWLPWTSTNRREIGQLSTGDYTLSVRTKNAFSQVSEPVHFKFTISPRFFETKFFIIAVSILLVIAIYAYSLWRVYLNAKKRFRLEQLINKRTEELVKEQEKTDNVITRVLSRETASELKEKGRVNTQKFKMATVLFSDIEGFTQITEQTYPEVLIDQLDRFFFHFDTVVEKYRIEKIKTIGDAYMCAGGIPKKNRTNPIEVVLAALEMMNYMHDLNTQLSNSKNVWELRIGIDTGQVIAGVIGRNKLSYDIWGTTVNIASRMESSGKAGEINISENTFLLVEEYFKCTYRGTMPIKNRGDIDMYFVKGIKPALSVDGLSIEPNHSFKVRIQLIRLGDLEEYILEKLQNGLPRNLYYHDLKHTVDVYTQVELIGRKEGVNNDDMLVLRTAALFHDLGHLIDYDTHEEMSVKLAQEILPEFFYSDSQISQVAQLIMSTKLPPQPKTLLEEIICDADLDYLGRTDFLPVSNTLYKELHERGKVGTLREWNLIQKKFISNHSYFTRTARELRNVNKQSQLKKLEEWLDNN